MGSTINREKKIKENEITFIAKIDEKLKSLLKGGGVIMVKKICARDQQEVR